ncbi:MAG: YHS domain-containing protein [Dehalococcoidia bacterium]|nr:YHS domain-containing protein [Dehalococcoidia bacterium]
MQVNVKNPPGGTHEYNGQTYYFCGPGCRVAFSKDPQAYLSGEKHMKM